MDFQQKVIITVALVFVMGMAVGYGAGYNCGKVDAYNDVLDTMEDRLPNWAFKVWFNTNGLDRYDSDGDYRIDRPLYCV